jgi:outer membrane protein assembly factor BamD (BamD/ComL family)
MLVHENGMYKQYYEKGLELIKKEEYDAAVRCFNKSLRLSHYESMTLGASKAKHYTS